MIQPPSKVDPQLVYLDPFLIDRLRLNAGLSLTQLATKSRVAFNTISALARGHGVHPSTARIIAQNLNCQVLDLLAPWDHSYVAPEKPGGPCGGSPEWESHGYLDQGRLGVASK